MIVAGVRITDLEGHPYSATWRKHDLAALGLTERGGVVGVVLEGWQDGFSLQNIQWAFDKAEACRKLGWGNPPRLYEVA